MKIFSKIMILLLAGALTSAIIGCAADPGESEVSDYSYIIIVNFSIDSNYPILNSFSLNSDEYNMAFGDLNILQTDYRYVKFNNALHNVTISTAMDAWHPQSVSGIDVPKGKVLYLMISTTSIFYSVDNELDRQSELDNPAKELVYLSEPGGCCVNREACPQPSFSGFLFVLSHPSASSGFRALNHHEFPAFILS